MATARKTSTRTAAEGRGFTAEEKAAMRERAREAKAASGRGPVEERAAGEREIRAKIDDMPEPDRTMADRIHSLVTTSLPGLMPKTYYGMPAYAKDGKTICFFKPASKFRMRYATFGFQPDARLDDGQMWPVEFAVTELTPHVEARIVELVKKAAG